MIAAVVLAAGTSSRLGRPKQVVIFRGRPVLQHVIDSAVAAELADVVIVLGHAAEEIGRKLRLPPVARVVLNTGYDAGQASSLRAGIGALGAETRAALILLGDQPLVRPAAIRAVLEAYRRTGGPVVRASYRGEPGHPVVLDRSVWPHLETIAGDHGAGELLAAHPEWVVPVDLDEPLPIDLDTVEDHARLQREI